ncbi:MAG: hypothetical protein IJA91_07180 [Clostridia bacterium]|nr:hypothetical protein [Clostridia bacterium]
MKLKPIERICKASGFVHLIDEFSLMEDDGAVPPVRRQWISDGVACYPLDGLPYLDEESICAIFDVDAKKRDKLVVSHKPTLPGGLDFTDMHKGDDPLEELKFQMSLGGDEVHLFRDSAGALLVIKSVYRKPFDSWKEVECYKRLDKEGRPYVAVMNGCILRGLIYPYKIGE